MPELRWTLLILGVVFIAALAWWEFRRPRPSSHASPERLTPTLDSPSDPTSAGHMHREPTLNLPEMRAREQPQEIPVVEVADDSLIGLRMDGARPEAEPPAPESQAQAILPEPEPAEDLDRTAQLVVETPSVTLPAAPVVDWPAEDVRKIVALRLVSSVERFQGRTLRLALAAEGFVFGRFSIFHKPGADARAVVSAASLSKPGTFTPESMDSQRFAGLNLFAILPGPLAPAEAFEELLATARSLNDRLQGGLQDEHGKPLTSSQIASIRESLSALAPPPADGDEAAQEPPP
jgi:FtsZ-interacting cell division protein ZipA